MTNHKTALFYDTETTGIPFWKEPSGDPKQPKIVQLAACLVDLESKKVMASMDVIIDHQIDIPVETSDIHGITSSIAEQYGVSPEQALNMFIGLWLQSDARIAHNETFDRRLVRIALAQSDAYGESDAIHEAWKKGTSICTMRMSNPYTKAEGSIGAKWPKLSEALDILMGKQLEDAHSAMPDVLGCMDLYFHCQKLIAIEEGSEGEAA